MIGQSQGKLNRPRGPLGLRLRLFNKPTAAPAATSVIAGLTVIGMVLHQIVMVVAKLGAI